MCEQGKFPLHLRPSLGQMGKQFHAGAVKPEPGFCGSGFGFFQSVRCPIRWTKVTDALGTRLEFWGKWINIEDACAHEGRKGEVDSSIKLTKKN